MLNICRQCGEYRADKIVDKDIMECPECGLRQTIRKPKLFILSGASGVGKTTISEILYRRKTDYIVMESDILWSERYNTPDNLYREYRELWLRMCKNISQNGTPVLLSGCAAPDQFEPCIERRYFSDIYYLALVVKDELLEKRLREGRKIQDDSYVQGHLGFNRHLIEKSSDYEPAMEVLDISDMEEESVANRIDEWIKSKM